MKKNFKGILVFLVFIFLTIFIFRPIFTGLVPFSANLLVSAFNPWAQEKFPGWEVGIPNKPVGIDDLRIFYPQRNFTLEILRQGQFPLWNPYSASGNYHIGLSETAVFYPFSLLFSFLPQLTAWTILIIVEPILVALGMYLYLGLILKDKRAIFFGAITFAFSGVVITRLEEGLSAGHALLWLPFIFYGIEGYLQKYKLRYLFLLLFSLVSSLLAGWFQFTFYILIFSLIYIIFRIRKNLYLGKRLLVFIPYLLLPLVTLYHLLPALVSLFDSLRGTQVEQSVLADLHLMPLTHLLTYLFPDLWGNPGSYNFFGKSMYGTTLYIGLVPFIVFLFSLWRFRKSSVARFFLIASIVALLMGLDTPLSRLVARLPIPIVSSFLPNRIFLLNSFGLAVLSAFGMEWLLNNYKILATKKIVLALAFVGSAILITDLYVLLSAWRQSITLGELRHSLEICALLSTANKKCQLIIQARNIILPSFLFLLTALIFLARQKLEGKTFFLLIVVLTFFGQAYFANKALAFSNPSFVYPQHPVFSYFKKVDLDRFISTEESYIAANFPLMFRLFSPDGEGSMYPRRYAKILRYIQDRGVRGEASRVEAKISPSSKALFIEKNPYLLRFMQIDGIKYVVRLKKEKGTLDINTLESDTFSLAWENDTWQIFRYRNALPRFFWTNKYQVIKEEDKILETLFTPNSDPTTLVLEQYPGLVYNSNPKGNVELISYTPNSIEFKTDSIGDGLLYLSDNYSPNFKVLIDGKESTLLRANYSFRAMAVPAGKHTVRMYYNNTSVVYGFIVAIMILGASMGAAFFCTKRKIINI